MKNKRIGGKKEKQTEPKTGKKMNPTKNLLFLLFFLCEKDNNWLWRRYRRCATKEKKKEVSSFRTVRVVGIEIIIIKKMRFR
jgi:hypothetical protein